MKASPAEPDGPLMDFRMGKVLYKTEQELRKSFESDAWREAIKATNGSGFFDCLLSKRKAYQHEDEVRLMLWDYDSFFVPRAEENKGRISFPSNPISFISEIRLDPRIDKTGKESVESEIKKFAPELWERIKTSTLYHDLSYSINLT